MAQPIRDDAVLPPRPRAWLTTANGLQRIAITRDGSSAPCLDAAKRHATKSRAPPGDAQSQRPEKTCKDRKREMDVLDVCQGGMLSLSEFVG